MKKDRRPTSAISSQRIVEIDPFDEDETEKRFLHSKPACFIIFGKPGSGKTTVAKMLSRIWKCQLVNGPSSINQAIELQTEFGKQAEEVLKRGEAIPEELSLKILEDRLKSAEVSHYGYILDDFPCTSEEYMSIDNQFEFIKRLPLKPDFIINLKIPDSDLMMRRRGFRIDPLTNEVYTEEQYTPVEPPPEEKGEEEDEDDLDNGEDADENDENETSEDENEEFSDLDGDAEELNPDLLERLMQRTDDFEDNMEHSIRGYKELLLRKAEDFMANHERQKLIDIDANLPKKAVCKALLQKLESFGVPRAAVPLRLQGGEDQEEIPEDTETDDLLRTLAATETIAPGYRWRRSRWGRLCPVALYEGNIVQGSPQFAVSFLDKLYVMSSADALDKFFTNPRPYLLSPQPRSPCKLCILGPPLSGKTTLAKRIAEKYNAKIFDVDEMMRPKIKQQYESMLNDVKQEALEKAITRVSAILQQEKMAAEQARNEEQEESDKENEGENEEGAEKEDGDREKEEGAEKEDGENEEGAKEGGEEVKDGDEEKGEEDDGVKEDGKEDGAGDGKEDGAGDGKEDEEGDGKEDDGGDEKDKQSDEEKQDGEGEKSSSRKSSRKPSEEVVVDENHPQVAKIVEEALEEAKKREVNISPDEYIEGLEAAIHDYYREMQEKHPLGPIAGGWILDNFPHTRDQFNVMVERGIIPDNLICLKDNSDGMEVLLKRWYRLKQQEERLKKNLPVEQEQSPLEDKMPPKSAATDAQKSAITNFDKNWVSLQGVVRSINNIEPALVDAELTQDQIEAETVASLEAQFQYRGWEYTGMDQDEEEEDQAAVEEEGLNDDDEEEEDEDDVFSRDKRKPFGDTRHYCPVALKENSVLWPGQAECAAKYREKVFYFSSPDARMKFLENPTDYLADKQPLKPPSLRLLILGAKGSGKTLVGRELAKKFGVFHISFKDRLQELIIAKTKKRIGPDYPEDNEEEDEATEGEAEKPTEENAAKSTADQPKKQDEDEKPSGEEDEEEVEFTDIEKNIKDNIMEGEPLSSDTLDNMLPAWWNEEPYKSTGFILEGFPRTTEEVRFLSESGFYPDCVINLATEENDVIKRLMPPLLDKWKMKRDKRLAKKKLQTEIKLKLKEEEKQRRKEEKLKEIAARKAERLFGRQDSADSDADSDEMQEDDEDEEEEDIDEIIEAEMAEEEEDEDEGEEEETEEDATERIRMELAERFDEEMEKLSSVQEVLDEYMIPRVDIEAGRKANIVQFVVEKNLKPVVENRDSLFDRCQTIHSALAKQIIAQGYKQYSRFGKWCPVQLSEGDVLPPFETAHNPLHPVIYRQHVYFFSSEERQQSFMLSPFKYIHQPSPKPTIPIRLAIVGPPKSGKTTLAKRFAEEYGIVRMSAGEALRNITENQTKTQLAQRILEFLKSGETVPDELVVQAIDVSLLSAQCQMRGYILDGFPVVSSQLDSLTEKFLIPYKVIELDVANNEVMKRAEVDRQSPLRTLPLHDSTLITTMKLASYQREIGPIKTWYQQQHRNWVNINGGNSKWKVWNRALNETKLIVKKVQVYLDRTTQDKAASISELCVTPSQLSARLGIFGHYCPVSFVDKGELVDCAPDTSQKFAAEFRGHYYKLAGEIELGIFLENPERYTPPDVDRRLPPDALLPKKLTAADVKEMFPAKMELAGYCPVTYLDGSLRYESLLPGEADIVVQYKEKLYLLASECNRDKFMRLPEKYSSLKLPHKLPPKRDALSLTGLPMLGYMEQTMEVAVRRAANAAGSLKPKYPFLSAKQSALIYMAYHLKANNPKSSDYVRRKYKKKLDQFEACCELIEYLGKNMTRRYKDPEDRPLDFDHKMTKFMSLKQIKS
eukprot:gene181-794_t